MIAAGGRLSSLKGFIRSETSQRCELCSLAIASEHQHLLDPASRRMTCSCDGCAVLFDASGATKLRRVPREVRRIERPVLGQVDWERSLVPTKLAFFYKSSHAGRVVAIYPSAAGITESVLDDEPWASLARWVPAIAALREDVEALLVNRLDDASEYFIAPIDRCFALVGTVRRHWTGISGGDRVWDEVRRFFAALKESAAP